MRLWNVMAVLVLGLMVALWALDTFVENSPLPKLVGNMTGDFYGDDPEFQQRVSAAYPAPYSLAILTKDLAEQGFTIEGRTAVFETNDIPCRYTWAIIWQVEGDKATRIRGEFIPTCP